MAKVVHFEIPAESPEKISKFYTEVFGWKIEQWGNDDYWLVDTGLKSEPGIGGGIYRKKKPTDGTVNTVAVMDLDAYMEKIKLAGGQIIGEPMDIPKVGRNVMALDPEGNLFGIIQFSDEDMASM